MGGSKPFFMKTFPLLLLSLLLAACGASQQDPYAQAPELYSPLYANGFALKASGEERILYIKKSWQGQDNSAFSYVLYPREDSLKHKGKTDHIPYPIRSAVCLSTTHIAYLEALARRDCIVGVSGARYVSNPHIQEAVNQGKVADVGFEGALNYERLLSLHPDVIFAYGVAGESAAFSEQLRKMGLKVVYIGDYLETHPLGKAEYLLAFSAFFEEAQMTQARTQFQDICAAYQTLKERAATASSRPNVLLNAPFKDVWYVPGSENYISRLLQDAGARSLGSPEGNKESSTISLEQGYLYALEADFWLHVNAYRSLNALSADDPRFAQTPVFRRQKIYNNTLRSTPQGGSDFWETGVVEPHIILADLIHIFHPQVLPQHQLSYYEKVR
jgi:ABC-type Fe3+-hydroxamate transport system, periplasmic component